MRACELGLFFHARVYRAVVKFFFTVLAFSYRVLSRGAPAFAIVDFVYMRWRQRGADGFCSQRFGDNTGRPSLSDKVRLFYAFYGCLGVYLPHLILLSPCRGHYLTCVMKKECHDFVRVYLYRLSL